MICNAVQCIDEYTVRNSTHSHSLTHLLTRVRDIAGILCMYELLCAVKKPRSGVNEQAQTKNKIGTIFRRPRKTARAHAPYKLRACNTRAIVYIGYFLRIPQFHLYHDAIRARGWFCDDFLSFRFFGALLTDKKRISPWLIPSSTLNPLCVCVCKQYTHRERERATARKTVQFN